jgi:hypothetical protein
MKTFPHLFSPVKIGRLVFKNRLWMAPLTSDNCIVDHRPSEQGIAFYGARARGGFAQVTVGEAAMDWEYGNRSDTFNNISNPDPKYWQPERVGHNVVIIGGGLVRCETGLHLTALGKTVELVEMADRLAADATESHRIALFAMMDHRTKSHFNTTCTTVFDNGVEVEDGHGEERVIAADTVIYAVGMKANTDMAFSPYESVSKRYFFVGDCIAARKVKQAVHEGYHAAMDNKPDSATRGPGTPGGFAGIFVFPKCRFIVMKYYISLRNRSDGWITLLC